MLAVWLEDLEREENPALKSYGKIAVVSWLMLHKRYLKVEECGVSFILSVGRG